MNKEKEKKLVPKLRFHEFIKSPNWDSSSLGKVGDIVTGKTPDTQNEDLWNGNILFITPTDIKDEKYQSATIRTIVENHGLKTLPIGSVVYTCIASIGKIAITKKISITNQQINSIIVNDNISNEFIYYYLVHITPYIKSTPASSTLAIINKTEFSLIKIFLPKAKEEQQKIADCLSSLDDLIVAENEKLDSLKNLRIALIQQMFPTDPEKVPKLRFPEFDGKEDWKISNIIGVSDGGLSNGVFNDPSKSGRGYKLINVSDMYSEFPINESKLTLTEITVNEFNKNKVLPGDIFFTRSSLVASGIAKSNIYLGLSDDVTFDGHLIRLRPNQNIIQPLFLHYLLKTELVRSQLIARGKTATMTTIGQSDVGETQFKYPSLEEQKKVANCLSSLDEQIDKQNEKIECLKFHKKGLMQQLFPTIN